jgi:hypothetical protein
VSPNERWVEWREGEDSVWSTGTGFDYTKDVALGNPTCPLEIGSSLADNRNFIHDLLA